MKRIIRIMSGIIATAALLCIVPAGSAALDPVVPFRDVKYGQEWYYGYIESAFYTGLMDGYGDGTFRPNSNVKRSETAKIASRILGAAASTDGGSPFVDVPASAWYFESVILVFNQGIMKGVSKKTFSPDSLMTREQLCTVIARLAEKATKKTGKSADAAAAFADREQISEWAAEGVGFCKENGIVYGYPDNTFRPGSFVTRAEVAAIFSRFMYKCGGAFGDTDPGTRFPTFSYGSVEEMIRGLGGMSDGELNEIKYLEEMNTANIYKSVKEERNGIFNEFRSEIVGEGKVTVPVIDGTAFSEGGVSVLTSDSCGRPWINYQLDQISSVRITKPDAALTEEAEEKGSAWLKKTLDPDGINTDNYMEFRETYLGQGYEMLKDLTVSEKQISFGNGEKKAMFIEYPLGNGKQFTSVWIVSDGVLITVNSYSENIGGLISSLSLAEYASND